MKKLAFLLVLVAAFTLALGVAAFAAETPHGPFDDNSAVCAACHRAHTSSAEYLLATPRVTSLCIACHDGSGADTNVVGGVYVVDGTQLDKNDNSAIPATLDNGYNHGTWGAHAEPLMGGGFTAIGAVPTTSAHMIPGTGDAVTTWGLQFGAGDATNAPGTAKAFLDCVDCHMPHRSPNYRMLRVKPTGYSGANLTVPPVPLRIVSTPAGVDAAAEELAYLSAPGRRYTEDTGMFNYTISNPTAANAEGISKWCGLGCHDFYYRSAVRGNNGETGAASPSMQTRVTTSIDSGDQPIGTIFVADTTAITAGTTQVVLKGVKYLVSAKTLNSITTVTNDGFGDGTSHILAGTPVSVEGRGMEMYYNLDGVVGEDPTFMHAIDVDLSYTPRNGSSGAQSLHGGLETNTTGPNDYSNLMPVADINANGAYDDTDRMTCLTCHRAHGTTASMALEAAIPARTLGGNRTTISGTPDTDPGVAFPFGADSMLLRLPNRAVCQQCHQMPTGF